MKKALKITGIIFGIMIILVIATALTFPGVPAYINIKNNCQYINETAEEYPFYDTAVPEDFTELSDCGITVMAPSGMYRKNPESSIRLYVDAEGDDNSVAINFSETVTHDTFDLTGEDERLTKDDLKNYCQKNNTPFIDSQYELLNYTINLSMDDFNIHSLKQAVIFNVFAEMKEIYYPYVSNVYNFRHGDYLGFVEVISDGTNKNKTYQWMISLYGGENYSKDYSFWVSSKDKEILKQIVASIEITEE